jgi:outer membrane protein TolC
MIDPMHMLLSSLQHVSSTRLGRHRRFSWGAGVVALLLCAVFSTAQAQPEREPLPELPPLEVLLDYAVTHAPELNVQRARIAQNRSEVVRTRRSWMDGATVTVGASYGSFGNQVLDEVTFGQSIRLGLKVSLFDLFGRDAQVGVFESRLQAAKRERDVIRQQIRQTLIQRYYNLRRARDLVRVRSEAYESTQTHRALVETAFQQGTTELDQVTRVTEVAARAQAAYAEARIDYLSGYTLLENLLGTSLDTLRPATASTR